MGEGPLIKRSVTLQGHRTSIALEAPFWDALDQMANASGKPLATLINEIDESRSGGLASAIRLHVLDAALSGMLSDHKKTPAE